MKKIYIHIGMHRTGTTTFQNFLKVNIDKLKTKKIGVFMPSQHKNVNSSQYFMMESRSRAQEYLELKNFLSQDYEKFIISAEELSKFDFEQVAALKIIINTCSTAALSIIACIRQANDYIDSAGAKLIEDAGYNLQSLVSCAGLIPKYSSLVNWHSNFRNSLDIFKFSDDTFTPLLQRIGIHSLDFVRPEKENSSKCLEFVALVASVNDPRFVQTKQLLTVICRGFGASKFILPQEVAASIGAEVNKEVRVFNAELDYMLDEISIFSRPKMFEYSNQEFLAACLRYILESMVACVPAILKSGALAYSNTKQPEEGFDPFGYLITNFDLCAQGINPKDHYLSHGRSEGRGFYDSKIIDEVKSLEN